MMVTTEDHVLFDVFPDLKALGNNIYFYEPPLSPSISTHTTTSSLTSPQTRSQDDLALVVLCTWLGGATPRRISKYLAVYRSIFPRTAVLLIRTKVPDISIYTFTRIRARLKPAREVVRRYDSSHEGGGGGMLLHMFSNGGSNIGIQLTLSLLRPSSLSSTAPKLFPFRATILDCAPGPATFSGLYNSASYSIPPGFLSQLVGRAALYPATFVMFNLQAQGLLASVDDLRADLNDPGLFPPTAPRLYLYSEGDRVVSVKDVERHIEQARSRGYEAVAERFEKWEHCALVLDKRYAETIRRFWESVVRGGQTQVGDDDQPVMLRSKL